MPIVDRLTQTPDVTPFPGLSHAVTVTGTLGFVSGQVPLGSAGNLVGPGDLETQTRQALRRPVCGAATAELLKRRLTGLTS